MGLNPDTWSDPSNPGFLCGDLSSLGPLNWWYDWGKVDIHGWSGEKYSCPGNKGPLGSYLFSESMNTQQLRPCQTLNLTRSLVSMSPTTSPRIISPQSGPLQSGLKSRPGFQTRPWCLHVQLLVVVLVVMEATPRTGSTASSVTAPS